MDGIGAPPRRETEEPSQALPLPRFRNVIWLMPAAYLLHIAEEYLGGFPEWVTHDVLFHFAI